MLLLSLFTLSFYSLHSLAAVTVYGTGTQAPLGISSTASATAASANYTGSAAYNPTVLKAPDVPNPKPPNAFDIQLATGGMPGMSIPIPSSFFGFSVEFSVANQVREFLSPKTLFIYVWLIFVFPVGKNRYPIIHLSTKTEY